VAQFIDDDPTLGDELVAERELLSEMYDILDKNNYIELWAYGHFHQKLTTDYNGTTFRMLGINELRVHGGDDYEEELNKKYGE
jgi:hypothetical protein